MKQCIKFPEDKFLAVRPCLVSICLDNRPAAKLLGVLLYRYNLRIENKEDAENLNDIKVSLGKAADQDTSFSIYRKQAQLVDDMCGEMTEKTLHDVAVPMLQLLGYLDIEESLKANCYIVHLEPVLQAFTYYIPGRKEQPELEKFLIAHLQLEKFLIEGELEKSLINKKKFLSALEKVLIQNRKISHCQRGRKPRPEDNLEDVFEETQNLEESPKNNIEEESKGEQIDTATFAPSLSFGTALSPQSEIDTQQGEHAHVPTLPDRSNPGNVDRHAHGHASDSIHSVRSDGEIDLDFLNAETEHRLPAIPKPAPPPGPTSHEQNRDAIPPRSVAVEADLGAVASVPTPPIPPEVSPPRTIRATVVSPDGPQLSVVPQKARRGKKVEQDKPAVIPKCDTREIQRRINAHRGYGLEEDVDIIRERKAIKTWCNLHTLEDYSAVMEALKRDKYWGKDENHYRIGGLTLLKETSRILAGREQTMGTPTNGQGRTQQWRSSFDDPDYDMSAEFYPGTVAR